MAYIYNLADNWVDAGVTYTSFKMSVTDSASNAASLLMDLQVGGNSVMSVSKTSANFGNPTGYYGVGQINLRFGSGAAYLSLNGAAHINFGTGAGSVISTTGGWGISATIGNAPDTILARDAANTLAQRNGVNAQTSRIYNTYTDASNYERGSLSFSSGTFLISTQRAGTGSLRNIQIAAGQNVYIDSGGTNSWVFEIAGDFKAFRNVNVWNGTSALATTATSGFLGVNSCAGPPTGVPASVPTGQVPLVFDTTNGRLYFYHGSAWHYVNQTA